MPISIGAAYNNSYHSPGFDITVTGLSGYDKLTIERLDGAGDYPDTPVRGADGINPSGSTYAVTDYEAPIGHQTAYLATASSTNLVDNFARVASNGWGTAPYGETWTVAGTAAQYEASGAFGTILPTGANTTWRTNILTGLTDYTLSTKVVNSYLTTASSSGSISLGLMARYVDASNHYLVMARFFPGGSVDVVVQKVIAGAFTTAATYSTGLTHFSGNEYVIKALVSGNTISVKIWKSFDPEPGGWLGTATLTGITSGGVGARVRIDPDITNTFALPFSFDDFTVTGIGNTPLITSTAQSSVLGSAPSIPYDSPGSTWLKSVGQPALSRRVNLATWTQTKRPGRVLGEYEVLGRRNKVVTRDVLGGREGTATLATYRMGGDWESDSSYRDVTSLLELGGVLLLQTTGIDNTGEADMYLQIKDLTLTRVGVVGGDFAHLFEIEFVEVDRPASTAEALALRSWQSVLDQNATWSAVNTNYTSWLDVLRRDL